MEPIPLPAPALADAAVELRPFTDADVPAVAAALADGEVSRWTATIPWPYTEVDARAWIGSHEPGRRAAEGLQLAITERGGEAVGAIGLDELDASAGTAQVGYWVARPSRGRGLATAALRLLAGWAIPTLGLDSLRLYTIHGNTASERVAAKAGFRVVEVIRDKDLGTRRATVSRWELRRP
jgi:RimJ/RimL family protein N-acetyltransferase